MYIGTCMQYIVVITTFDICSYVGSKNQRKIHLNEIDGSETEFSGNEGAPQPKYLKNVS